jgi:hypothetical protein
MRILAFLLMPSAVLSGVRMAGVTNDGSYFYLGLGISLLCAVYVYKTRKKARPA